MHTSYIWKQKRFQANGLKLHTHGIIFRVHEIIFHAYGIMNCMHDIIMKVYETTSYNSQRNKNPSAWNNNPSMRNKINYN